jgi:hypothetical protein
MNSFYFILHVSLYGQIIAFHSLLNTSLESTLLVVSFGLGTYKAKRKNNIVEKDVL